MLSIALCDKCSSPQLRRSRIRTFTGHLFSFALLPYRCKICDRRQWKFRFVRPAALPSAHSAVESHGK